MSKHVRWPWILVTVCVCVVDLVATVTYANDSFHTRTLSDIMNFIGGTVSGIGNAELSTTWASWSMVILYSRFVVLFVLNLFLVITLVVECNVKRDTKDTTAVQVEAPFQAPVPVRVRHEVATETGGLEDEHVEGTSTPSILQAARIPRPALSQAFRKMKTLLIRRSSERHTQSSLPDSLDATPEDTRRPRESSGASRIPRAGLTNSFRKMKTRLFRKSPTSEHSRFYTNSLDASPERSPQAQHSEQKRSVNFPENLSLPQRLENMIAEQQRRLDRSVVDTSGRCSPPRASQSLPHLESANQTDGRRGTAAELQSQLPWAYIPASTATYRMRDQLPPDEDLPPVPLPDYNAFPSLRKASVHRTASILSSLTQKQDYASLATRPPLTHSDVLY